ncbi:hypothetical protein K2173_021516 [Erythroxylum novogranatense]|uniref:Bidirectional sugar transporter SWEET n=1 Tax=Erythroxylum novogranatense TaxID=1862640 RepID=A0AAV8TRA9_9ROSI|nr:hypothetical protein K2173_021516 [Erythroxylum novogranatense]
MVDIDTARNLVGIIGNVISVMLFLSPAPTFIRIWKKKSVEQYSPDPYLAALVNCLVWVLYGLPMVHPKSILVISTNGSGAAIELVYLTIFLIYANNRQRLKVVFVIVFELIFMIVLSSVVLTVAHDTKTRTFIVGIMGIIFNIMMYAAPLSIMKLVIATKSVEYMPFFLSLAALGNGVAWTAYSLIRLDYFILIPNGIGSMFAIMQLILYTVYYKPTKKQMAARQAEGELGLSEIAVKRESRSNRQASFNMNNGDNSDMYKP